jgi:hypothetical protein
LKTTSHCVPLLPATLLALAAGAPCLAAGPAEIVGTWHARVAYQIRSVGPRSFALQTQAFVAAEQPARCQVDGQGIDCEAEGDVSASGHVYATGHASDGAKVEETYQKSANAPGASSAGTLDVSLTPARPSSVGQGLSSEITISGMLKGVARAVIQGAATQDRVSLAQPIHTTAGDAAGGDPLQISLKFDASPGTPSAQPATGLPDHLRDALGRPNGELGLAMGGLFLGAQPAIGPGGRVSVCFTRKLSGQGGAQSEGTVTIEVDYCGWLTAKGDTWAPKNLPAADAAPAPK